MSREEDGSKQKREELGGGAEAAEKIGEEEELEQTESCKLEEEDGPDMVCVHRYARQSRYPNQYNNHYPDLLSITNNTLIITIIVASTFIITLMCTLINTVIYNSISMVIITLLNAVVIVLIITAISPNHCPDRYTH